MKISASYRKGKEPVSPVRNVCRRSQVSGISRMILKANPTYGAGLRYTCRLSCYTNIIRETLSFALWETFLAEVNPISDDSFFGNFDRVDPKRSPLQGLPV